MKPQFHEALPLQDEEGMNILAGGPCNWDPGDESAVICAVDIRKGGATPGIARSWGLTVAVTRDRDETWSLPATSDPAAVPPGGKPPDWTVDMAPGPFEADDEVRCWATAIVETATGTQYYTWPHRSKITNADQSA